MSEFQSARFDDDRAHVSPYGQLSAVPKSEYASSVAEFKVDANSAYDRLTVAEGGAS